MPFNKKNKPKEEKIDSLTEALGISDDRAEKIAKKVHALLHKHNNHHSVLVELNENLDDNELLFAAYAYGRMVEDHENSPEIPQSVMDELDGVVKKFFDFLGEKGGDK